MFKDSKLVLVVAVAVGLWTPLARMEWFSSHEQTRYVLRTVEWASELRVGELYPRWASDFYGGYGSPFFMFYAPAVFATAGLLTSAFSVFWALKLVVLAGSIASGVGTFALVFGETRDQNAAFLAAIAYLASPYRLLDLYERGDLSEFTAIALLPVVLALYRAAAKEAIPRRASFLLVAAAASHAVMVLSHTILGLWGTIIVGLVVAASAADLAWRGLWRRGARLLVALFCAPGLAAVYLVPAIAYRGFARMQLMIVGWCNPQNQLYPFSDFFLKSTLFFSRNFLEIGWLLAVSAFLVTLGLALNFRVARAALGWVALTVFLVGSTLPIASGLWAADRFPLAQFIQFPWRLLGPASLTAAVALGIGTAAAFSRLSESTRSSAVIALATAILGVIAWPHTQAPEAPISRVPISPQAIRASMESTTNVDEYLPLAVPQVPSKPVKELVVSASETVVERTESHASHHYLSIEANRAGASVELAVHAFPGWRVTTRSGPAEATLDTGDQGLIRVNFPTPGQYSVKVYYGISPAGILGTSVSALSLVVLGLLLLRGSRWWRAPLSTRLASGGAA
ncbi:MAG: hypothetical protein WDO74_34270 [Pseudomonadota bacterium]